jgi:hypothetical protein
MESLKSTYFRPIAKFHAVPRSHAAFAPIKKLTLGSGVHVRDMFCSGGPLGCPQ